MRSRGRPPVGIPELPDTEQRRLEATAEDLVQENDDMQESKEPFVIAIPIYEGVDLLDISAPCEIFNWLGKTKTGRPVEVHLTAKTTSEPIRTRPGTSTAGIQVTADKVFEALPRIDMLFVPGGGPNGLVDAGLDPEYLRFLTTRGADLDARYEGGEAGCWVASVCEGALLLAKSGLLNGYKATTHWAFYKCFGHFREVNLVEFDPPNPRYPSYIVDRNRITGGGISSGLEECMHLCEILAGSEAANGVRRSLQYYPLPVNQDLGDPPGCPFPRLDEWF